MLLPSYLAEKGLTDGEFGAALDVSAELVRLWRHGRRQISAKRAIDISRETGIPLHKLRPDLWRPESMPVERKPKAKRSARTPETPTPDAEAA